MRLVARNTPPPIERHTHIALADHLRRACRHDWWWTHIGHGEYRSKKTGALLTRMGLKRGVSDFLFISPTGEHYWLELKTRDGALSDHQADFLGMLRARKVPCAVARSFGAAVAQLESWGAL